MTEFPVIWGGCGVCNVGCGIGSYLVWNRAGTVGTFACWLHLKRVRKMNPKGKVERL